MNNYSPLRTAIAGVSGYAGGELVRLLLRHPRLTDTPPILLGRPQDTDALPISLTSLHPQLTGLPNADNLELSSFNWKQLQRDAVDILFLATPHEQSREWVPLALAHGIRVIDLSGAWRLHNPHHRAVYQLHDADPFRASQLQAEAVYGSPEIHAPAIAKARLIANPGCYATSIILALAPLLRANLLNLECGIVCDAKSGVSGAGKTPSPTTHFMHAADNLSAYAIFGHRHTGELLEQLNLTTDQIQFTPHLLPIPRGILSTMYMRLNQPQTAAAIQSVFDEFFADAPLVRVRRSPQLPQIQYVVRTNFCDLGFQLSTDGRRLVVISVIDNLLKGAASQAVQNMNLMAGWHQAEGLL
ncbi:MAG: N-acetyl-gamma-glutamyl-phosphate reductase [Acidobacteria bacterium]|nr:N-acetyl-gamma-glutamyl-phosphate reductase [Acidobacteriota bacterium]